MNFSKETLIRFRHWLLGPDACFYAFAAFMVLVLFTGGGSRSDIQSLVVLRPLAILFGAYALTCMIWQHWKGRMFPLCIAIALVILMAVQLIPLPPSIWTGLPGRQNFAEIADLAGLQQPWRPLTLSPSGTMNSLFSLAIPVSAMMLYLNLPEARRSQAVALLIGMAMISALWAMFQLAGSARGPLYLYNITNNGAAVGLMANRNHQAVLLAATIIMVGWYGTSGGATARSAMLKLYLSLAAMFILIPLIFVTGSRAGLVLMAPALMVAMFLFYNGRYMRELSQKAKKKRSRKRPLLSQRVIVSGLIAAAVGLAALSVFFSRSLAFDRLFGGTGLEELRLRTIPTLFEMLGIYSPWGSGFGTFEHIYRIHEPQELLRSTYFNHAHSDWIQFPIEGGLPAIVIGAVAAIWFGARLVALAKNWQASQSNKFFVIMAAATLLIFLGGSIGDYPLRVPSLVAIFAVMACVFSDNVQAVQRRASKIG